LIAASCGCHSYFRSNIYAAGVDYDEFVVFVQVFFARLLLAEMNKELKGLRFLTEICLVYQCYSLTMYLHTVHVLCRCVISGSGKIAMHVLEKLLPCGAIPVTVSGKQTQNLLD
jgi:hypothetical protein